MKIGITGCKGRMGVQLTQELLSGAYKDMELAGGTVLPEDMKGESAFFITTDADELFQKSDLVIDFTTPAATRKHLWLAAKHKKALIVATTGLSPADELEMKDAAVETPILYSANMSLGVNVLMALVEKAAAALKDGWDIEIFEAHHKHKVDAPSGTALALGKSAAKGRDIDFEKAKDFKRYGETGPRQKDSIGFSVARGGDVAGEHTVSFYGEGERIALSHSATNRALFARGALHAARWLYAQKRTGLYSMKDVLGL